MNLYSKNLFLCFIASLVMTVIQSALHLPLTLSPLSPFIVMVLYQKSLRISLWITLGSGWMLDFLSSHAKFGLYAASFTIATSLLYRQKRRFFADNLSTLPLMTFFYSSITTIFMALLIALCEKPLYFSAGSFLKDFFFVPAVDGIFAFGFYILPFLLLGKMPKKGEEYFLNK